MGECRNKSLTSPQVILIQNMVLTWTVEEIGLPLVHLSSVEEGNPNTLQASQPLNPTPWGLKWRKIPYPLGETAQSSRLTAQSVMSDLPQFRVWGLRFRVYGSGSE